MCMVDWLDRCTLVNITVVRHSVGIVGVGLVRLGRLLWQVWLMLLGRSVGVGWVLAAGWLGVG